MKNRRQNQQASDDEALEKAMTGQEVESSDEDDDDLQEILNVDFEFFDPKGEDYHGVKALLQSYLDDTTWDIGGFVDVILSQPTVGTVIKTAEDESPLGVITVLNLGRYKEKRGLSNIYDFLKRNVSDSSTVENIFKNVAHEVGLLVSERLINIPEELVPPLYKGLLDEVSWATEDEPTKALRESFKFKQYLIITRIFQQSTKKKKSKKRIATKKQRNQEKEQSVEEKTNGELIYVKYEDELLHRLSHWSCQFPANSEAAAAHEVQGLKQFRLVMLLRAAQMDAFKSQFCIAED